jgi:hypothetical protein
MKVRFVCRTIVQGVERHYDEIVDYPSRLAGSLIESRMAEPVDREQWREREHRVPWILRWRS